LNCMRVWNRRGLSSAAAGPLSRKGPGLAQRSPARARPLPGSALAACGPGARAGAGATCAPRIPEAIACAALRRRSLCLRLRGPSCAAWGLAQPRANIPCATRRQCSPAPVLPTPAPVSAPARPTPCTIGVQLRLGLYLTVLSYCSGRDKLRRFFCADVLGFHPGICKIVIHLC